MVLIFVILYIKNLFMWNCIKNIIRSKNKTTSKPIPSHTVDELKNVVRILFVDDKSVLKAKQLKEQDHWKNVIKIKDVNSLSQTEVKDAHIIFVDIQGVGKSMGFSDEGLGLIVALKKQYPDKKVVMYSAESQGQVDAFHEAANIVDGRLRKGADLYEFSSTAERLAQEAFCFDNCVKHIKDVLHYELNVDMSEDDIKKVVIHINDNNLFENETSIAQAFNLSNVGSVASIVQLLLMPITPL